MSKNWHFVTQSFNEEKETMQVKKFEKKQEKKDVRKNENINVAWKYVVTL